MFQQDKQQAANLLSSSRALCAASIEGTHTKDSLKTDDIGDSVVSVCGVLLPRIDVGQKKVCYYMLYKH